MTAILSKTNFTAPSILSIFNGSSYTGEDADFAKGDLAFEMLKSDFGIDEDYVLSPPTNVKVLNCLVYYVMAEMASDRLEGTIYTQIEGGNDNVWAARESLWHKRYLEFKADLKVNDFYDLDNLPEDVNNESGKVTSWANS